MSCDCSSGSGYDGGYGNGYNGLCNADTPYPSVSSESVPSLINNLTYALYGQIQKNVTNGQVTWTIPCDPNSTATINGIPRVAGEGLLCYIIRALNLSTPSGFVTVNGVQTLANKTLDATCSLFGNAATATTATKLATARTIALSGDVTGTATSFNGSANISIPVTINAGSVTPSDLSTGGPSWDTSGNLTAGGVVNAGGANSNQGSLSIYNATAGAPATTGSTDSAVAARIRTQGVALDIGTYAAGQTWIQNRLFNNNASNTDLVLQPNGGNVGIGTSSPTTKLQINTGSKVIQIDPNGGSGDGYISSNGSSSGMFIGTTDAKYVNLYTNNLGRFQINSDGVINTQGNPITNCKTTAKAWVRFFGTATPATISASYNVSSVTRVGTGNYVVNFSTAFADTSYAVTVAVASTEGLSTGNWGNVNAASVGIYTGRPTTGSQDLSTSVAIFGN